MRRMMTTGLLLALGCGDAGGTTGAGGSGGDATSSISGMGSSTTTGATAPTGPVTSGNSTGTTGTGAGTSGGGRLMGDEWFASDLDDAANAPTFGFDFFGFSQGSGDADMTVTHHRSGPLDRPYARQDIHTSQPEFGGGWTANPVFLPSQCSWGDNFFLRFSFMPIESLQQEQKIVILSRGDVPNEGRFIVTVEDWGNGYAWRLQKDGGDDLAQYPDVSGDDFLSDVDTWSHIQVEARYSSAPGVGDGYYRLWVNNNDQASPDAERTGIVLESTNTDETNYLGWSGYHQVLSGTRSFGWADVRVGPSFDPEWAP